MPSLHLSTGEGLLVLAAVVGLGALVGLGEGLRARGMAVRTTRGLVHGGVSLFVAATPLLFTRPLPVAGLALLFTLINAVARARRWWAGIHEARPQSWGTVTLPLSVLPALAATWAVSPNRILAFQLAYLVLGLADPAASWVGERRSKAPSEFSGSTLAGSLTFAGVTLVLTVFLLATRTDWSVGRVAMGASGAVFVATLVEAISRRGWDNFFIVVALVLVVVPLQMQVLSAMELGVALLAGVAFGGGAYGTDSLDGRGAATGGLFAATLVGLGGWAWIVPGIAFFGLSSALTGLNPRPETISRGENSSRRTQAQVLANGGVAWAALAIMAIVPAGTPTVGLWGYAAFVGALAAAAADTWATELGTLSPASPWSLRTGHRVPAGTSGAVSLVGSGAAVLGAASVVGAALLVRGSLSSALWQDAALLGGAGLAGMLADSVAGAFLQAQYRTTSGEWVENPPTADSVPERGWSGIGNHAVNLIGTIVGALVALSGFLLVG